MGQLRLELDPFGDVSRVEDDTAHCLVLAEVGHMRLEVPPFSGLVHQSEDDLARAAVSRRGTQGGSVLRAHEPFEAVAEHLRLGTADHGRDRAAYVTASVRAENEDQIRGRGNEASKMSRLAPRRGDERPGEQE